MEGRSSAGCVVKGLITVAVSAVLLVLIGIFTGYYIIYHTAIPAKGIVSIINNSPNIQIEGVTGSISSGFAVETIRIKDDNGNTNELDDVRLFYEKDGETFIITELHIGRGHFYYDRSTGELSAEHPDEMSSSAADDRAQAPDGSSPLNLIIQKASINNIIVEDVGSGEQFVLDKAELTDLKLGKPTSLGSLIVASSTCSLNILPIEGQNQKYTVDGSLKPGLHKSIIAPIAIKGTIDNTKEDEENYEISAFENAVTVKIHGNEQNVEIKDLTLAAYLKDAPPLSQINVSIVSKDKKGHIKGSFVIGKKTFSIDQEVADTENSDEVVVATNESNGVTYTIESKTEGYENTIYPPMELKTQPAMSHEDAVAMLVLDKKADSLSAAEKLLVDNALKHITAPGAPKPAKE